MEETHPNNAKQILDILEAKWMNGVSPQENLPGSAEVRRQLARILGEIEQIQKFCRSLSNGDLSASLKIKGVTAGSLRALQASLLHVVWQAKMVSEGNFTHRIDFMGEFADVFNTMVGRLNDTRSTLKNREQELVETNNQLRIEVMDRRIIEEKLSLSNQKLLGQLKKNERLQKRLKKELIRDSLTGLFNRRYLMERIDPEFVSAAQDRRPVSILLMDIDFFKRVNDNYGHPTGDLVLQTFAGLLRKHTRTDDLACRIGGEEFLLLMPSAPVEKAFARAEKFRQIVEKASIRCNGDSPKITISIGVASLPTHGVSAQKVMLAADKALYSAKNAGRNQVHVAETAWMG